MSMQNVTVWRTALLPGSETFIRNQINTMTRWRPTLVGAVREESHLVQEDDHIVFRGGLLARLRYRIFRATGRSVRVERAIRSTSPRVIHAHFAPDGWRVLRSARRLRIPLIVTLHGYDVTRMPSSPGRRGARARRRLRALFRGAHTLIAVSEFIRDEAVGWGAPPEKVVVRYLGIPGSTVSRESPKLWDVVFVGRLVEKKGADDLLEGVSRASAILGRALQVAVIGDGPLRSTLQQRATSSSADVHFLGTRRSDDTLATLAAGRILVGPSRRSSDGDAEGLPTVYMEAAALGVPAVGYRHAGITEFVVEGETGLLSEERDVESLAQHIVELLSDDEKRSRMGSAAQLRVEEHFDMQAQTAALEDLYDAVARSGSR